MNASRPLFVSTAIPYVNAPPHLGFAAELLQADVIARHARQRGRDVCFVTGTDDNSLKNVQAARAEGCSTLELVERNAARFSALARTLDISFDRFVRTATDASHRHAVERLWRACNAAGDLDRRAYGGLYCLGCEQYYAAGELVGGVCPEHRKPLDWIEEENYFFRASRHQNELIAWLDSDAVDIRPSRYRSELLSFLRSGLADTSVSRSALRAQDWDLRVPDDPSQVVYVWFDALANYLSALDFASDKERFRRFWLDAERVHVFGKGITRFHGVFWPAILRAAGLPLPTRLLVHSYLTVDGQKIGKSLGNAIDPLALVADHGSESLRYFLLRHIRTHEDSDFSEARLARATTSELADQLGNLERRITTLITRLAGARVPEPGEPTPEASELRVEGAELPQQIDAALEAFEPHAALDAIWTFVGRANRYVDQTRPWSLAKDTRPHAGGQLATSLYACADALRVIAEALTPFLPVTAQRIATSVGVTDRSSPVPAGASVRIGEPLFPK